MPSCVLLLPTGQTNTQKDAEEEEGEKKEVQRQNHGEVREKAVFKKKKEYEEEEPGS